MQLLRKTIVWILLISATSCSNTDNDIQRVWEYANSLADRIAALERWQEIANLNLANLQQLLNAMQSGKTISSVLNTGDGYQIVFSDETSVIIKNGEKGDKGEQGTDGQTIFPVIAVRDSSDGNLYWTVNGDLLRTPSGIPVRANGSQGQMGEPGPPGIPPKIRINATTHIWEVSLDTGITWESLGVKAVGEKGDPGKAGDPGEAIFASNGILITDEYVEFTLADGKTKFKLPKSKPWVLIFPEGTLSISAEKKVHTIPFILSAPENAKAEIYAMANGGWTASVNMNGDSEGEIIVVPPSILTTNRITVLAFLSDGKGMTWTYELTIIHSPVELAFVPGGDLSIIGQFAEGWRLSDFWMGKKEVTVQQFCDFLNSFSPLPVHCDDPRFSTNDLSWFFCQNELLDFEYSETLHQWHPKTREIYFTTGPQYMEVGDYPVTNLSWDAALAYCQWAGGDLPTCMQWYYAARGSDRNPEARTELYPGSNDPGEVAWFGNESHTDGGLSKISYPRFFPCLHPGGTKKANYLGIYDMEGNVQEYCRDLKSPESLYLKDLIPAQGYKPDEKIDPPPCLEGEYYISCGESCWCSVLTTLNEYLSLHVASTYKTLFNSYQGFRIVYNTKMLLNQ